MDALLQVDAVTSSQDTRALRKLFDYVNSHIRSLGCLGVESDSYGSILCPVLLNKIPPELHVQLIVSCKVPEHSWTLDKLMEAIEEELMAHEKVSAGQSRLFMRHCPRDSRPPPTAATLVTGVPSNVQQPCCYCSQLHSPSDCDSFASIDARKQSLRRSGRCFSCLKRGHLSRDCRSAAR